MSWRETLGVAEAAGKPHAHNPHNAQNTAMPSNSADSADSALAVAEETASRLLEALSDACRDLPIAPAAVRDALAPEDIEDWLKGEITNDTLAAFVRSLVQRREMDEGKRPAHYTERATCKHCGPIWLWFPGEVLGCPLVLESGSQPADTAPACRPLPRLHPLPAHGPSASGPLRQGRARSHRGAVGHRPPLLPAVSAAHRTRRQRRISRR
ncbi:hypothetical protein [Arhodomonas aquaeolei]|uniref:hypothetical protein n=1 Tax=Arhodomonas aquaeolei TaxID=2369 RepID=UPI0003A4AF9B|nr:hypothetical protein [Arhodomonas aquaeolei]